MKNSILFLFAATLFALTSCNSNDDETTSININGITITDDADCCTAEEALAVYQFLQTVQPVEGLNLTVDEAYDVQVYTRTGKLYVGYNDLYFVATKKATGNYIKFLDITNVTPLMLMTKMNNMQHSTPVGGEVSFFDSKLAAVKHGWVSFLMPTSEAGSWTLAFDVEVLKKPAALETTPITVDALPDGQSWLTSFKLDDDTYYLSLVNPTDYKTGTNTIQAYVSKKSKKATEPYQTADETFTIDIDPRMHDMGNHTSPGNEALTPQNDGSYKGTVNLSMTGLWRIHLTVKDAQGNVVAGGDELSSLSWDVTI